MMQDYLREQARRHPAMQPQDAIKLCYQAAFGAEHLLKERQKAAAFLREELAACPVAADEPLYEWISPLLCRVNLRAWKARMWPEQWLLRLFERSCAPEAPGKEAFDAALEAVTVLCAAGQAPFSMQAWMEAKNGYLQGGLRPVHHSERYRAAEKPAYRLVSGRLARMFPLLGVLRRNGPQVIALDGRAASGKTTLSEDFAAVTEAGIVHMDDFFLPPALRTPQRLQTPGGNVHYERFMDEVLPRLKSTADFAYRRFDCASMELRGERAVRGSSIYLVEGAYSCHPALQAYMDVRAFSDIDSREQKERIFRRNGAAQLAQFETRWIPMEESYFAAYGIRENAQVIL